ncbi:7098_t:CDS:10 [Paraglomus brasilianum]|uniref:7098_t:CDS:1 n=1 Tax=Paraglomus brasilianum TaxID=144538 RepID=A0A9N9FFG0_9GLOM|nr:7098_t:CDS:10 [Paraglomus brasilianum]
MRNLKHARSSETLKTNSLLNVNEGQTEVAAKGWASRLRRSPSAASSLSPFFLRKNVSQPVPNGSIGGSMLNKLREMSVGYSDVVQLLISKKVTLLLPEAIALPSIKIDRTFVEDHVIITQKTEEGIQAITLSGLRAFIRPNILIAIGAIQSQPNDSLSDESMKPRSIFDSYTLPKNLSEYPTISVINDNAESMLHGMSIQGIVIEAPIIRQEIAEQVALIWEIEERLTWITDLPGKLPDEIQRFVQEYGQNPPLSEDLCSEKIQEFYQYCYNEIESVTGLTEDAEREAEAKLDCIEKFICSVLYTSLFCPEWGDDELFDEALGSKIAALNILELGLGHLGITVQPHQQVLFDNAICAASDIFSSLETLKTPGEKLGIFVRCHQIVVDTLKQCTSTRNPSEDVNKPVDNQLAPVPPSPTEENKNSAADAIFPVLIYILVKANPKKLNSHIRFIQRYRAQALLHGESAYCLTNTMAAVSFLENVELQLLGLAKVQRFVFWVAWLAYASAHCRTIGYGVAGAAGVAGSGLHMITDVVDTSYKKIGWMLGYSEDKPTDHTEVGREGIETETVTNDIIVDKSKQTSGETVVNNPSPSNVFNEESTVLTIDKSSMSNEHNTVNTNEALLIDCHSVNVRNEKLCDATELLLSTSMDAASLQQCARNIAPPIDRFIKCPIEEFKVVDVPELLSDYKRIAADIEALGLFAD